MRPFLFIVLYLTMVIAALEFARRAMFKLQKAAIEIGDIIKSAAIANRGYRKIRRQQ